MRKLIYTTYHNMEDNVTYMKDYYQFKSNMLMADQGKKIIALIIWSNQGVYKRGYKAIARLDGCFNLFHCRQGEWFTDDKDLKADQIHNGGINRLVYRMLKNDDDYEKLVDLQLKGELTNEIIDELTDSLKDIVEAVVDKKKKK